jgi:hypothetical protein
VGSEGSLIFKKIDNPTMLLWRAENGEALMHFEAIKAQDQKLVASN